MFKKKMRLKNDFFSFVTHDTHSFRQKLYIYIIKQDINSYIFMLRIAGQAAGPIGLKFFVDTQG